MKKIIYGFMLCLLTQQVAAQKIGRITLTGGGSGDVITYELDNVLVNISKEGKIINWGTEDSWGKLLNYMGRVEYYDTTEDAAFKGKVKTIGLYEITYYASYDDETQRGKIKTIGNDNVDYFLSYEDDALKGKIKDIGGTSFTYYASFEDEAYKGKFKSIGNTNLTYYAAFEDKAFKGKVKSIDNVSFSYYSSFDRKEYVGSMKPGSPYSPYINGIKFLIRN